MMKEENKNRKKQSEKFWQKQNSSSYHISLKRILVAKAQNKIFKDFFPI